MRRTVDEPRRRRQKCGDVEPGPERQDEQERGGEQCQMAARDRRDIEPQFGGQRPAGVVDRAHAGQRQQEHHTEDLFGRLPQRELEQVEPDVVPEDRVRVTKWGGVPGHEPRKPLTRCIPTDHRSDEPSRRRRD